MKKKSVLALSLVMALGATMMVGGSLAWFSDTDETTNTFTVGSIEIEQVEDFEQNSQLIPVGSNHTPADDENFIKKEVSVKNTGKNPAYVQTFVAIPAVLDNSGILHIHDNATGMAGNGWVAVDGDPATNDIDPVAVSVMLDDDNNSATPAVEYNVFKYRNEKTLDAPTATTESKTDVVILGIYIDERADIDIVRNAGDASKIDHAYFSINGTKIGGYDVANMTLNVYVATQAVQSQGFETAADALNAAFPNHPWATP
ncbi:MAG: hypothetical protein E7440_07935 [Ruminococcaceae bacterium]|nr:hypothetical protein [Oscillospiraceae bacterium]